MEQLYPIQAELPEHIYNHIILLSSARGKTFNQIIVDTLEQAFQANFCDCDPPDFIERL